MKIKSSSVPYLCHLELTYACNQNCIFCYNPKREKIDNDFSRRDGIIKSLSRSRIPHICFLGGEPSLLPVRKLNEYIEILAPTTSVTITTNGLRRLQGISENLAFFAVPIHGPEAKIHEFFSQTPGSFGKTLKTIEHYVSEGRVVRCVPLLTGYNFDKIYKIIELASNLGMESVYVDRYEDGGIGAKNSAHLNLKPDLGQFREALTQIIQARKDFKSLEGRVGFGTAIPFCLDRRMITEGITCSCGVGKDFCAINPQGEFRLCNQSQLVFGKIPEEDIRAIWNKKSTDIFQDSSWIDEPCKSCKLLCECLAGCKVDVNCSDKFCVDYAVRGHLKPLDDELPDTTEEATAVSDYPKEYRVFKSSRYMKLTTIYPEKLLITRYQTVQLDKMALKICQHILKNSITREEELVRYFSDEVEEPELRIFLSRLIQVEAIIPSEKA